MLRIISQYSIYKIEVRNSYMCFLCLDTPRFQNNTVQ